MDKLITSEDLYYQLEHHPKADSRKASIQYIDFGRLKTIPYHEWIPEKKGGLIPWHRVQGFLYGKKVLWDRPNRMFYPEVYDEVSTYSNIDMLKWNGKIWSKVSGCDDIPRSISILTFNCLMDHYEKQITNIKFRMDHIVSLLVNLQPDIICLQEITNDMKEKILKNKVIREKYYVTSNTSKIYCVITLTKYLPQSVNLISFAGNEIKKYLDTVFKCGDSYINIVNLHLTSNCQSYSDSKQQVQLSQLFNSALNEKVIICGDFNTEAEIEEPGFYDAWPQLHTEPGYTVDPDTNSMTRKLTRSFNSCRIDRFVCKEVKCDMIEIVFNQPISNDLFPSDHYGVFTHFKLDETMDIVNREVVKSTSYDLHPAYRLCLIPELESWHSINAYRQLYDENVDKIPPHVTLFPRFIDENYWPNIKEKIQSLNGTLIFGNVEIFQLEKRYALVLTSEYGSRIASLCTSIANELNISLDINPHITLGFFDTESKAQAIKQQVNLQIYVPLSNVVYLKKIQEQYQVYDVVGNLPKISVHDIFTNILRLAHVNARFALVGSGAILSKESNDMWKNMSGNDLDIVLKTDNDINNIVKVCLMNPYVKYVELIESKVRIINLILHDNTDIDLIIDNGDNRIAKSKELVNIVKEIHNFQFFQVCLTVVREWVKRRCIYGSKFGYFNGVTWLVLVFNMFINDTFKNKKEFLAKFLQYYSTYDWSIPINPCNREVRIESKSDQIVYISCLNEDINTVRTITIPTFNTIKNEFNRVNEHKDLNKVCELYTSDKVLQIQIADRLRFARLKKIKQIMANLWKVNLRTDIIRANSKYNDDEILTYDIYYNNIEAFEALNNYIKPFSCCITAL